MNRIFCLVCACALVLSGCNRAGQLEPSPQMIKESSVAPPASEAPVDAVTSGANVKSGERAPFDIRKFHVVRTLELPVYNDSISGFVFSPDGKTVAGVGRGAIVDKVEGGERGVVFLFDVKTGALLKRLATEAKPEARGFGPSVDRAVWSPNGKLVAAWNVDSSGVGGALHVWNVASGQRAAVFRNPTMSVTNAAWADNSSLLVARNDPTNSLSINGQLMICNGLTGQVNSVYDLGNKSVASIHVPLGGTPQLLVLESVGPPKTTREPDVQSSIRAFDAGVLGPPSIQFKRGEAFLAAAFAEDGRVALSGVEQSETGPVAALYAVGDTKTGQIVWQIKKPATDFSLAIALYADEKQFWARTPMIRKDDLVFEMSNGKSLSAPTGTFPFFAPDGKRFVRLLNSGKYSSSGQLMPDGQKPHLKIAQIYER